MVIEGSAWRHCNGMVIQVLEEIVLVVQVAARITS